MPLFTNPVTLNDGSANRVFSFRGQIPDSKSIVGSWIEPAAAIEANSELVVKHDTSGNTPRHLLQRSTYVHPSANTEDTALKRITVNVTIQAANDFTDAEIQKEVNLIIDALAESSWLANFRRSMI